MVKTAGKKAGPGPIRALNQPAPVRVQSDGDLRPVAVALRRRRLRVASIEDVWEVVDEWWRAESIARRYYRVALEDGSRMTVFRDLSGGLWYEQRV